MKMIIDIPNCDKEFIDDIAETSTPLPPYIRERLLQAIRNGQEILVQEVKQKRPLKKGKKGNSGCRDD